MVDKKYIFQIEKILCYVSTLYSYCEVMNLALKLNYCFSKDYLNRSTVYTEAKYKLLRSTVAVCSIRIVLLAPTVCVDTTRVQRQIKIKAYKVHLYSLLLNNN